MKFITLNVDIDLDDALGEITTDDLAKELARRGVSVYRNVVATAIAQIRRGDALDAITTLEREFWPKWSSVGDSHTAYSAATRPANDNKEAAPAVSATSEVA